MSTTTSSTRCRISLLLFYFWYLLLCYLKTWRDVKNFTIMVKSSSKQFQQSPSTDKSQVVYHQGNEIAQNGMTLSQLFTQWLLHTTSTSAESRHVSHSQQLHIPVCFSSIFPSKSLFWPDYKEVKANVSQSTSLGIVSIQKVNGGTDVNLWMLLWLFWM